MRDPRESCSCFLAQPTPPTVGTAVGEKLLHLHVRGETQHARLVPLPPSAPSERVWVGTGLAWPPPLHAQQEDAVPCPHHQSAHSLGVTTRPVHTRHPRAGTTQQGACQQHAPVQAVMLAWTQKELACSAGELTCSTRAPLALLPKLHKTLPQSSGTLAGLSFFIAGEHQHLI